MIILKMHIISEGTSAQTLQGPLLTRGSAKTLPRTHRPLMVSLPWPCLSSILVSLCQRASLLSSHARCALPQCPCSSCFVCPEPSVSQMSAGPISLLVSSVISTLPTPVVLHYSFYSLTHNFNLLFIMYLSLLE